MEEQTAPVVTASHHTRHGWAKLLAIIIILLLLLLAGWLAWQLKMCRDEHNKLKAANTQLQKKVDALAKQAAAAQTGSSTAASGTGGGCTSAPISQSLKDNLPAAVSSKNYAALIGSLSSPVTVVIAASAKSGSV